MIAVAFRLVARPDAREELLRRVKDDMLPSTRAEPGCRSYRFYQDVEDPDAFTFVEEWESWEALEDHLRSAHVGQLLQVLPDLISEPPDARFQEIALTKGAEAVEEARRSVSA